MSRLEAHRRHLELTEYRGQLLRFDELNIDERTMVHNDFMGRVRERKAVEDLSQMWALYIETLHSWGVMCPHPQGFRLYDGFHQCDTPIPFDDSRWFCCRLCDALVINR